MFYAKLSQFQYERKSSNIVRKTAFIYSQLWYISETSGIFLAVHLKLINKQDDFQIWTYRHISRNWVNFAPENETVYPI